MKRVVTNIDLGLTGHLCNWIIGVFATQTSVKAKNKPVLRAGDPAKPHTILVGIFCKFHEFAVINMGSRTVFVKNKPMARAGDSFDKGKMIGGRGDVRAGG